MRQSAPRVPQRLDVRNICVGTHSLTFGKKKWKLL